MTSTLIEAVPCMLVEMNRCDMSHIASHQHATLYMFDGQLIMLVNILPHGQVALALLAGPAHTVIPTHPACSSRATTAHTVIPTHPACSSRATTSRSSCATAWLLTATGVSALLLTDQSGKPLAACGAEALRRIGVEAIFQHLAVDLNDMFYTQPEWPRLTDKARAEVEGSCLEPAVRACPSQPSHGRRPATGAPHGRMPPHPPITRRPRMGRSLLRFVAAAADREPRAASKDTEGPRVHVDTRPAENLCGFAILTLGR